MVEFEYKTVDDGTLCVSGYMGNEAVVEVPAEADGLPVTVIGDGLFSGHAELTELKLPDGITDLGEFILDGCVNLRQLQLPAALERFWGYTFVRCGLEELTIPDGVRSIPSTFLLDKEGRIVQRDLRGADLERAVKQLIEQ